MPSTPVYDAYNPGVRFIKNERSFSIAPIANPAHNNIQRPHAGDDWGTGKQVGVPISSAADGVVVRNQFNAGGYGNYLVIEHTRSDGTQYRTLHAHMENASTFQVGQIVRAGETIGIAGSTGGSTGIHLHFEVMKGGGNTLPAAGTGRLDPAEFIAWGNGMPHMIGTDRAGNILIAQDQ